MTLPVLDLPESLNYIGVFLTLDCNLKCAHSINGDNLAQDRRPFGRPETTLMPEQWVRGKKVIALFGPTAASEIHDAPNLMKVFPDVDWPCLPCLKSHDCALGTPCMERIAVEHVAKTVERILRCPVDTSHDAGARP